MDQVRQSESLGNIVTTTAKDLQILCYAAMVKYSTRLMTRHIVKGYLGGRGGIVTQILNVDTSWKWVYSFTLRPLNSRKELPVLTGEKAGWAPTAGLDA
jgi:hypothetical protein